MIVDISLITPAKDDIVVVTLDYGNLPMHMRSKMNQDAKNIIKETFPNNQVIIKGKTTTVELKDKSDIDDKDLEI